MTSIVDRWRGAGGFQRLRWVLALAVGGYLITVFVPHGWDKFDPEGFWSAPFERWGYPVWLRILVGVLETGGGLALVVPPLATWGGLATATAMAGAFYTRLPSGHWIDLAWITGWLLASLWIAWEWRDWRLPRRSRGR